MNATSIPTDESVPLTFPYRGSGLSKRDRVSLASDLLPPIDFMCFLLAGFIGTVLYSLLVTASPIAASVVVGRGNVALIGAVLAPFVLYDRNFAAAIRRQRMSVLIGRFGLRFLLIASLAIAVGTVSQVFTDLPPSWVALWLGASAVLTVAVRVVVATVVRSLDRRGAFTEAVAIVGGGAFATRLDRHLRDSKANDVEMLGTFGDLMSDGTASGAWPAGSIDELIDLSKRRQIDWILVALPSVEEARLHRIVERLEVLSVPIAMCPASLGLQWKGKKVEYTDSGMPVMLLADRPIKSWNAVLKRVEDVVLSMFLILLLLPLLGVIALAIKLDSPGPIIFRQRRHAFNNSEFDIYKFRSMCFSEEVSGASLQQTTRLDRRITRVGRFLRSTSLDELPQLFNVLKGEMSLVGPRPHSVIMRTENRLGSEISSKYAHRHRVKPGITGWSQVHGARGATTTTAQLRRRVALDLMYIDSWSIWLDLRILVMTLPAVLRKTNAY